VDGVKGFGLLHEDRSFLVVDKPAGMHTAPLRAGETGTLLDAVISAFPDVARVPGRKEIEHGLLHRLDRETSGVVVIARTPEAFAALCQSFDDERTIKTYAAACVPAAAGFPGREISVTSRFAPHGAGGRMVRVVLTDAPARLLRGASPAEYTTRAVVRDERGGRALLHAAIVRGFRHQVRAHLSHAGFPIVGDSLYGAPVPPGAEPRMYLHALCIELPHPETGAAVVVEAPLPRAFAALLEEDPHGLS
jgi:23S rRNA pseudouridine1911/1915/1917 synthase